MQPLLRSPHGETVRVTIVKLAIIVINVITKLRLIMVV